MRRHSSIRGIMTSELIAVEVDSALSEVRIQLAKYPIHHVPVVKDGKLVGLVSSTDMVRLCCQVHGGSPEEVDSMLDASFRLEDEMTKELVTIDSMSTVREAATVLSKGDFHSLPVIGPDRKLLGIVTSTDIIRYHLAQY